MFHTVVLDNFFDDVNKVINMSKKLKYYKPSKDDNWGGVRTKPLHSKYYDFCNDVVLKIAGCYFPNSKIRYKDTAVLFSKIKKGDKGKTRFHRDKKAVLAAVIYLFNGDMQSGTTIFFNEKEKQTVVAAKLNTMIAYSGEKHHGFTSLKSLKEERLTLNVFINNIYVLSKEMDKDVV